MRCCMCMRSIFIKCSDWLKSDFSLCPVFLCFGKSCWIARIPWTNKIDKQAINWLLRKIFSNLETILNGIHHITNNSSGLKKNTSEKLYSYIDFGWSVELTTQRKNVLKLVASRNAKCCVPTLILIAVTVVGIQSIKYSGINIPEIITFPQQHIGQSW